MITCFHFVTTQVDGTYSHFKFVHQTTQDLHEQERTAMAENEELRK